MGKRDECQYQWRTNIPNHQNKSSFDSIIWSKILPDNLIKKFKDLMHKRKEVDGL